MVPEPLAVDPSPLYVLIGVLVTALLGYLGNRFATKATGRQADAQTELGAGALALQIATRADAMSQQQEHRLNRLERWRRAVLDDWWPLHEVRDKAIEDEVHRLDPSFVVPPRGVLPPLDVGEEPTRAG